MNPKPTLRSFLLGCSSVLAASSLHAATLYWDDGDSYELSNNSNNDTAVFGGTAGTVTIDIGDDLGVTVGGLTFSAASYILAGATGETGCSGGSANQ